jgi:hypothetical protein
LVSISLTRRETVVLLGFDQRNDWRIARAKTRIVPVKMFWVGTREVAEVSVSLDIKKPRIIAHITASTVPIQVLDGIARILTERFVLDKDFSEVAVTLFSAKTIPVKGFIIITRIVAILDGFDSFTKRKVACWGTSEIPSQVLRGGTRRIAVAFVGFNSWVIRRITVCDTNTIEFEEFIIITSVITILDTTNSSLCKRESTSVDASVIPIIELSCSAWW